MSYIFGYIDEFLIKNVYKQRFGNDLLMWCVYTILYLIFIIRNLLLKSLSHGYLNRYLLTASIVEMNLRSNHVIFKFLRNILKRKKITLKFSYV